MSTERKFPKLIDFDNDTPELATESAFDFDATYTANGWSPGIAWKAYAWHTNVTEETVWSGYEEPDGTVLAHMVGDDRPFCFDPDELTPIPVGGYCVDCGQVGCKWHTEGEEDDA